MAAIPGIFGSEAPIGPDVARRRAVAVPLFRALLLATLGGALVGAAPPAAPATTSLEDLMARFARMPGLVADFREEKTLALLRDPLVSEGTIYFSPPDHLARVVRAPVASRLVLDGDRLGFSDGGAGSGGREIAVDTYPTMSLLVDSMRRILSGDLAGLEALYRIDYATDGDGWSARLEPTAPELRSALRELRLRGSGLAVGEFVLVERNGDTTRMVFSDVHTDRRFDDEERARVFGMPGR